MDGVLGTGNEVQTDAELHGCVAQQGAFDGKGRYFGGGRGIGTRARPRGWVTVRVETAESSDQNPGLARQWRLLRGQLYRTQDQHQPSEMFHPPKFTELEGEFERMTWQLGRARIFALGCFQALDDLPFRIETTCAACLLVSDWIEVRPL